MDITVDHMDQDPMDITVDLMDQAQMDTTVDHLGQDPALGFWLEYWVVDRKQKRKIP